jgi:serpin B
MKIQACFTYCLLTGILLVSATGCGDDEPKKANPQMVKSDLPRDTATSLTDPVVVAQVRGNHDFAFDAYHGIADGTDDNVVYSPYSVTTAFGMQWAGALGQTEAEIADVMGFVGSQDDVHRALGALDLHFDTIGAENPALFRLSVANAMWALPKVELQAPFLDVLAAYYDAGMYLLDFEGDPDGSRRTINAWVEQETNHTIRDLLPSQYNDMLSEAWLVLTNAIYFKADWENEFNAAETTLRTFHAPAGDVNAEMMYHDSLSARYFAGAGFQAVELPYKGGHTAMLILLPEAGGIDAFEQTLDATAYLEIVDQLAPETLSLRLPKFRYELATRLDATLKGLGMALAFDGQADFSGIHGGSANPFFIGAVVHKAFIALDEKGTEAGAATAIISVNNVSGGLSVNVDRPFLYAIRELSTGTILFLGRVTDPTK